MTSIWKVFLPLYLGGQHEKNYVELNVLFCGGGDRANPISVIVFRPNLSAQLSSPGGVVGSGSDQRFG